MSMVPVLSKEYESKRVGRKLMLASVLVLLVQSSLIFQSEATSSDSTKSISKNIVSSVSPEVAVSENNVYVVWSGIYNYNLDIFFAKSTDEGESFSEPINISHSELNSALPQISISNNDVYIVWEEGTMVDNDIYLSRSYDDGDKFTEPTNISNSEYNSEFPQISVSDKVFVTWTNASYSDDGIVFSNSNDKGNSFSIPKKIGKEYNYQASSDISAFGNKVYVVWDLSNSDTARTSLSKSEDGGETFDSPKLINKKSGYPYTRFMATDEALFLVWNEGTNGKFNILFKKISNNGEDFGKPIKLGQSTVNPSLLMEQQISVSGDVVNVVWFGESGLTTDIFLAQSFDSGETFKDPVNVSNSDYNSYTPDVATAAGFVYAVWSEAKSPKDGEIFFAKSSLSHPISTGKEVLLPSWIKNNAKWWAEGNVGDKDFVQGIQYLIQKGIMKIPETKSSDSQSDQKIPTWVISNAGWWADGKISDGDFVSGIQYLISNGIMKVGHPPTTTKDKCTGYYC